MKTCKNCTRSLPDELFLRSAARKSTVCTQCAYLKERRDAHRKIAAMEHDKVWATLKLAEHTKEVEHWRREASRLTQLQEVERGVVTKTTEYLIGINKDLPEGNRLSLKER